MEDPAWGTTGSNVLSGGDDEEDDPMPGPSLSSTPGSSPDVVLVGPSYHLTDLSCRSLIESKHIGQRAQLLSELLK